MTEGAAHEKVVLFDGVCGLCNALVKLLVRLDRRRALRYAPLQGATAAALRARHGRIPEDLSTMVFVDGGRVFTKGKGVCRVARYLPWPWKFLYVLFPLPQVVTNPFYDLVAKLRYRFFGKYDVCRIPDVEERELFLP